MNKQILVSCACGKFYISKNEKSQCSKCGGRNENKNNLPEWIRYDKAQGKYILIN